MEGIDKVMLSGMTAFVTTKSEDVKVTRGTIRKAFDGTGLKVERVGKKEMPTPKEAYELAITGGT